MGYNRDAEQLFIKLERFFVDDLKYIYQLEYLRFLLIQTKYEEFKTLSEKLQN